MGPPLAFYQTPPMPVDVSSSALAPEPPLVFALVGCGAIAPTQAQALKDLHGRARLARCVDVDPERAARLAERFGATVSSWEAVLNDPGIDVVTFCTPSGLHGDLAGEALAAGKHVIVEKPMEVSLAACDRLLDAQKRSGRRLGVISQHRFDPASLEVRNLIEGGHLGRLIAADLRVPWYRTQEYYDSGDWRGTWALDGGGCLINQGIHTVDLMLWLCGPVREVYARTAIAAHERIEVEDLACATLTFANGALGTLLASTAIYPGFPARLALHGTEGSAVLEGDRLHTLAIRGRETLRGAGATAHALQVATGGTRSAVHHAANDTEDRTATDWKWGDAHRAQFADFIDAVRRNRPPAVDGRAGRAAVALIQAIYESARSGRPVSLAPA